MEYPASSVSPQANYPRPRSRPIPQLRTVVSVWGRFHGFDLARELHAHSALSTLITSYPTFAASRFGVDQRLIQSYPAGEVTARLGRRWPAAGKRLNTDEHGRNLYMMQARRALRRSAGDVFVGWSGCSLPLLLDAKARGMVTVLERGSAHIVEQTAILAQEYEKWGLDFRETPRSIIERELEEYDTADYIAVPSQFVRQSFVDQGFPVPRLLVNPYGTDLSAFHPAREPHEKFRILQVGQVSIRKGFHYVIQAFQRAAIPNSELVFVGSVTEQARKYLDRHRPSGVVANGPVPQEQLPELYAAADVACLASVEEGLALVLLQAAASGLPIVCTTNTGGSDVVGSDGGIVVPPADPNALAEAFTLLHQDGELRSCMGRAARSRSEAEFGWQHYGARAVANYRGIVDAAC